MPMQISFILNQTLDFSTYDEQKKNESCYMDAGI